MDPNPSILNLFIYCSARKAGTRKHLFIFLEAKVNVVIVVSCSYYEKNGHTKFIYFRKHGFQQNSKNKGTRNTSKGMDTLRHE